MQKKEERMDIAEVLARRRPQRIAKRAMDIVLSAAALAVLWARYRQGRGTNYDPIMSTDAGAAALVYSYLALHGKRPSLERAARRFGCSVRRLAFYAGRIVSTLEEDEGETDE